MVSSTLLLLSTCLGATAVPYASAFQVPSSLVSSSRDAAVSIKHHAVELQSKYHNENEDDDVAVVSRRSATTSIASLTSAAALIPANSAYAEE